MMKKNIVLSLIVTFAAGFVLGATVIWNFDIAGHDTDHAAHSADDDHAADDVHADQPDDHNDVLQLTDAQLKEYGIELATISSGQLKVTLSLPGEIVPNPDNLAHIVPVVAGIARQVDKSIGDKVAMGDLLAVIESRELAESKSLYLADLERLALAEARYHREQTLWQKEISSEQEFLDAKQAFAEARIDLITSEQKLHAIGFTDEYLKLLPNQPDQKFTRFEILAPFDGVIIERHITIGEKLADEGNVFTLANLDTVWVNLTVYQKNLDAIRAGLPVVIRSDQMRHEFMGTIAYVSPLVDEATRTATARVVVDNHEGHWRPGLFVTGEINIHSEEVDLVLPRSALQTVEGQTVVFVKTQKGFVPQPVELGRMDRDWIEVRSGLYGGEDYVVTNAFVLKSEFEKSSFGHGHAH